MNRDTTLATLLVAAACLTVTPMVPRMVGYLAVAGVTAAIVAVAVRANDGALPIHIHPAIALPLVVLWLVLVAVGFAHPSFAAFERVPTFIVFSAIFVFVVPAVLPVEAFGRASAYLGAVATVLSIPGILTGRALLGSFEVSQQFLDAPIPGFVPFVPTGGYYVPTAGFNTQNHFALLTLFGVLAGTAVLCRTHSSAFREPEYSLRRRYDYWLAGAVMLCTAGLVLSRGRAALGALALAVVLTGAYRFRGWRGFTMGAVIITGAATAGILAAVFAPDFIRATGVSLTGRTGIWSATVQGAAARPLIGWGFVDPVSVLSSISPSVTHSFHNSYLRMFFVSGVVGGIAHLALFVGVLWCAVTTLRGAFVRDYALSCAVIPVAILLSIHVFGGETIFGLSLTSVLSAVFVGYTQPTEVRKTLQLPAIVQQWTIRRRPRSKQSDD